MEDDIKNIQTELINLKQRIQTYEKSAEKKEMSEYVRHRDEYAKMEAQKLKKERQERLYAKDRVRIEKQRIKEKNIHDEWNELPEEEKNPYNYMQGCQLHEACINAHGGCVVEFMRMYKEHCRVRVEKKNEKLDEIKKHIDECMNIIDDSHGMKKILKNSFDKVLGKCKYLCSYGCICGYCHTHPI
jgi:DNA anti-recombination protein RmuC